MRLPPALTAPVAALTPRQRRLFAWLTTAALVLLLLWAAQLRAIWPRWPVSDPDTWGYLHPALSKLRGGAFEHTYGRNFVYPGFLYLLLRATADFRAITDCPARARTRHRRAALDRVAAMAGMVHRRVAPAGLG